MLTCSSSNDLAMFLCVPKLCLSAPLGTFQPPLTLHPCAHRDTHAHILGLILNVITTSGQSSLICFSSCCGLLLCPETDITEAARPVRFWGKGIPDRGHSDCKSAGTMKYSGSEGARRGPRGKLGSGNVGP